jgi:myo-inositol-1(or 4)-monophosphatase
LRFDHSQDLVLLREAIHDGAALAKSYAGRAIARSRKSDGSAVTEADMAVDALLQFRLREARPDYGWLSEESAEHGTRITRDRVWVVDPIDGTRDFLNGGRDWTVAGCLVESGVPLLSCVINPLRDEVFEAKKGSGAWLNGRQIFVTGEAKLAGARVATGARPKKGSWHAPWPGAVPVFTKSSIYRMALVAAGRADASFALNPKWEWDIAAGALLVSEAGGTVTSITGAPLKFNSGEAKVESLLAAAPDLHRVLAGHFKGSQRADRIGSIRLS